MDTRTSVQEPKTNTKEQGIRFNPDEVRIYILNSVRPIMPHRGKHTDLCRRFSVLSRRGNRSLFVI